MPEGLRMHGNPPFRVAVVHGGPGAAGDMAPVARSLGAAMGVLEPLQSAVTVRGQAEELAHILEGYGSPPMVVIGFSWGAWLACITASQYPSLIGKLILIGCPSFEEKDAAGMNAVRMQRLPDAERVEVLTLLRRLDAPAAKEKDAAFARLGALLSKTDAFDPVEDDEDFVLCSHEVFTRVWGEAAEWRRNGTLLASVKRIRCPVVAIHGEHDPHPAGGSEKSLSAAFGNFRFVLLKACGHKPWIERRARDAFFQILEGELR